MMRYYGKTLSRKQREVYELMQQGFDRLDTSIRIPKLPADELADVYLRLKLDEPLLFFVVGYSYRFYQGAEHVELLPEYLFDKAKIREHRQAITARIQRLTRPLIGKPDREKEQAIHDFILQNVRYDKLKKAYSHEIIGPLTQGVGVCEGIAKTVKVLCDAAGLPCIVALSHANPDKGIKYRHAWNVIRVDGKTYHVDATFDNSLQRGVERYDYFNLDDRRIFRDHEALVMPVPECSDRDGYYYRNVSLTKMEQVESRVKQALRKKQPHFVFHWRGGGLNSVILQEIIALADKLACEKGKAIQCAVNMSQAIVQLDFVEEAKENITVQQPDEGQESNSLLL